jgi:DNA primase
MNLDGEGDAESAWRFAHGAGAVLVKHLPHALMQEFIKADRGDRIFVDTRRNLPGATCAAVYAVRAKPGAPISAPCTWAELEGGTVGPSTFTLRTMAARIGDVGELWSGMDGRRCAARRDGEASNDVDRRGLERGARCAGRGHGRHPASRPGRGRGRLTEGQALTCD